MTITAYLSVAGGSAAIKWYGAAFGARVTFGPLFMDDGRIGHAELAVFDGMIYLSDAHPEIGVLAPEQSGSSVTLHVEIADVDSVIQAASHAGAEVQRPPEDTPHGRIGVIRDPFGHRWMLNQSADQT